MPRKHDIPNAPVHAFCEECPEGTFDEKEQMRLIVRQARDPNFDNMTRGVHIEITDVDARSRSNAEIVLLLSHAAAARLGRWLIACGKMDDL